MSGYSRGGPTSPSRREGWPAVTSPVVLAAIGAAEGVCIALRSVPWLTAGGHRYADEWARPAPPMRWVGPVAVLVGLAVGWARADQWAYALVLAAAGAVAVVLAAIDLDVHRLPDRFTLPALWLVPAALGLVALAEERPGAWVRAVVAGLGVGALFLVLALVSGGGFGLGDVKLAPSVAALTGYAGWGAVVGWVLVTFVVGGVVAMVLLLTGRANVKTQFAFGPVMLVVAVGLWLLPDPGAWVLRLMAGP